MYRCTRVTRDAYGPYACACMRCRPIASIDMEMSKSIYLRMQVARITDCQHAWLALRAYARYHRMSW